MTLARQAPIPGRRLSPVPAKRSRRPLDAPAPQAQPPTAGIRTTGVLAYVVRRDARGRLRLSVAWPLWALLVLFPVWWAIGLGSFVFPLLAVPMLATLVRRRPLRYPSAWPLWALFLLWAVLGQVMWFNSPTGTHAGSNVGRLVSESVLLSNYAAATIVLLFVGNLSAAELPLHRVVRWMGALFFTTVAGGLLGTFAPHFGFNSPLEYVIPSRLHNNPYVSALIHPASAQVQSVLGTEAGRAAAPFAYTNFWANNISLLLIWFVCGWALRGSNRRKVVCVVTVAIAVVPIVYSLNRGLWIGIAVTVLWCAVRLFLQGKVAALLAILAGVALGGVIFVLTPLHSTFNARLDHPESNTIRSYLTDQAIKGAKQSPILGWGGTRRTNGSAQSITIGRSANCAQCGEFTVGSNGQLWGVLFYQGFVGAGFFFGFFALSIWIYRRDRTAIGQAGVVVVALTFVYMLFYNSVPSSLTITMISVALLWRSRDEQAVPAPVRAAVRRAGAGEPAGHYARA